MTTFQLQKDKRGQTYWHATRKGRIVADSGEGYSRPSKCRKSLKAFLDSIRKGAFKVVNERGEIVRL